MNGTSAFLALRDQWLGHSAAAAQPLELSWPARLPFNWARDYFDHIAAGNQAPALRVVDDGGNDQVMSFAALSLRSNQVANFLASHGVARGDRVLIMLGNAIPLWETMLATIKLGAVMIPATTLMQRSDLEDRLARGQVKAVLTDAALASRFAGLSGAPVRLSLIHI